MNTEQLDIVDYTNAFDAGADWQLQRCIEIVKNYEFIELRDAKDIIELLDTKDD